MGLFLLEDCGDGRGQRCQTPRVGTIRLGSGAVLKSNSLERQNGQSRIESCREPNSLPT
jgi:hypothetical protein